MKQFLRSKKKLFHSFCKSFFWFSTGVVLGLFFLVSFSYIAFEKSHSKTIYPGVMVTGISFGGKSQQEVEKFFAKKNEKIQDSKFIFIYDSKTIVTTAKDLSFGYNEELLANQAYSIGRSQDLLANMSLVLQAYLYGINLPGSYHFSDEKLNALLSQVAEKAHVDPVDALFTFQNGRVSAFKASSDGQELDLEKVKRALSAQLPSIVLSGKPQTVSVPITIKILKPGVTTDKVNNLGIKELIGAGTSLFQGSILNRVHNVTLASTRLNGVLIKPGETFSFNKAVGDVSAFTGYKQAYVIESGKTVLGDGGGLCQVSTTLFRAALDAGLPIEERHAHAYRVHYYEEDSGPGIDATVYSPSIDFKFKNDTRNYILVQTVIDPSIERLSFYLYGTQDGRKSVISDPVITSQSPAPEALYQDDPTLPKGTVKQVDFSAAGANVYFTRVVTKDRKVLISEKYTSNYRPWQAIFLRGTKE